MSLPWLLLLLLQVFSVWRMYGFLYDGYDLQRGLWWWEIVVISRKVAILFAVSFVRSPFSQVSGAL